MEQQELKDISISIWDKLRDTIEKGDKAKAKALVSEIEDSVKKSRAGLTTFTNLALTALAEKAGEEAIPDVLQKWCADYVLPLFGEEFFNLTAEERLRRRAFISTSKHGANIEIEEDAEKFIIKFPCSTGRVVAADKASGRVKQPHAWSFGEKGICYYCSHCALAFEVMPIERYGYPLYITFPPKKAGDVCLQYLYKDISKSPEKYRRAT